MADKDPETQNTDTPPAAPAKNSDKKLFIGLGALFLILAVAYGLSLGPVETNEPEMNDAEVEEVEEAFNADDNSAVPAETVIEAAVSTFNLDSAQKERILGDTSAPIKISEHSSFSCGHCGKFHRETFGQFKAAYIDTGKAYLVFSDFPLNAPALHASMATRCVAEDRYFDFVDDLFATQDEWAYEQNYLNLLEAKAANYGLDKASFADCVRSDELQKALLKRMKGVQEQWKVSSTPTFVVNNQEVISGGHAFPEFEKAIQDALAKIEAENSDPEEINEGE